MSKYSKEDNTCRHRIIGNSKKMTCFTLLFLHSKKVFDGRCAKCSRCGKWVRPSKALTQAQGVLVGMFISLGLGFVIGGSYPFHYFAFVTIPLAIVLNAVRAALLACNGMTKEICQMRKDMRSFAEKKRQHLWREF